MPRRTKQDAQATRAAVLDAAECVFLRRGVAHTSLAEIAQAAGVTRGAIYGHFENKTDLFAAMMERVTLPLETEIAEIAQTAQASAPAGDVLAQLRERAQIAIGQIVDDEQTRRVIEIAMLMVEHVDELGELRTRRAQTEQAVVTRFALILTEAARQRGTPLPAAATALARGLHALLFGLIHHWLLERGFDLTTEARQIMDAYLRGIGLPPAP
jgi:TetR/AcrR family acrAB operon transcriptional repressor